VILGSVSPFSSASIPLFVGTGDRYIGTEMTPRLKITSVAYSLRAAQADGVADNTITAAKIADEPGIGHSYTYGTIALTTTVIAVDSVILNCPSAGYVIVNADGFFGINHTAGIKDFVRAFISTTPAVVDFNNFALTTYEAALPTSASSIYQSFSLTKVGAVAAGINKYYLNADVFTGNGSINRRHLTAIFFPTAYGTVASTKQGLTPPDDGSLPAGIR
jgi:hypothetical protein